MALTQIARKDSNGTIHHAHVQPVTLGKIEAAEAAGAEIIINTNWQFKGKKFTRVEKLSQTNSRFGGKPKHIIWACYR